MSLSTRPESGNAALRGGTGVRSSGSYTPPDSVKAGKIFTVETISPTSTRVSIDKANIPDHPTSGSYLELSLTFNPQGGPVTNLDGQLLARWGTIAVNGWQTYRHNNLRPGFWAHYGLFARYLVGGDNEWHLVAEAETLQPENHQYGRRLFERLPRWYQDRDDQSREHIAARIMDGVGSEIDISRTWVETLGHIWDPSRAPARLLRPMGETLGLPYESTVGDVRVRKLLSNLIYLRKLKGTREATESYLTALSGYRTLVHQGPNIMLTVEDSEFRYTPGSWVAGPDCTATREDPPVATGTPEWGILEVLRDGNGTGVCRAMTSESEPTQMMAIAAGTGREVQVSMNARCFGSTKYPVVTVRAYDVLGAFISEVTSANMIDTAGTAGVNTTFDRVRSGWVAVADSARYVSVRIEAPSVDVADGFQIGEIMLVDRRYRPEGVPGYVNSEPFSENGGLSYMAYDFYDSARATWINSYPQRTNFAVNSDFTLNDLPADGWTVADAPTYGNLPFAYATYTSIAATETDYADLVDGYDSITPDWTINFNTGAERLEMISGGSAPYLAQVRAKRFPVLPGISYSGAVELLGAEDGTTASLRMQWFRLDDSLEPVLEEDGVTPVVTEGAQFELNDVHKVRVVILDAIAPEGAGWCRMVVETANTVAHTTYVHNALIEDSPIPGGYFNGDVEDGAPGDFGYTGADKVTFSAYYLNFAATAGASANRVLTASTQILPVHSPMARVTTAFDGLYDDLA